MRGKKISVLIIALIILMVLAACTGNTAPTTQPATTQAPETTTEPTTQGEEPGDIVEIQYGDGMYRGIYADRNEIQVSVQFNLKDNVLSNLSFRQLYYAGTDYRTMEESNPLYGVVEQNKQVLEYLEGKTLESIYDLYAPGDFVEDVDTFTGATLRANKIISAIKDGLNRGMYVPDGEVAIVQVKEYNDGMYRGIYADRDEIQVSVQFDLVDNVFSNLSFRQLYYSDTDYRTMAETDPLYGITKQNLQVLEYLNGKPVEAVYDLYAPGEFVEDVDTFTGATLRANKILSAINDGLNRGMYVPAGEFTVMVNQYEDGRYRGIYADRNEIQVSIQFNLTDNVFSDLSFRQLSYNDTDYRTMAETDPLYGITKQNLQVLEYLDGKSLEAMYDLFAPGEFVEDVDAFTGATLRANKIFSSIMDALNRGIY
jgi:uncharacterized protein with FMN-binding domain